MVFLAMILVLMLLAYFDQSNLALNALDVDKNVGYQMCFR